MRCAGVVAMLLAAAAASAAGGAAVTPVTVRITDTRTTLSRLSAPPGSVVFAVTNAGRKPHAFTVAGHATPRLGPGTTARLKVTLDVPVGYAYSGTSRGVFRIVAQTPVQTTTSVVTASPPPVPTSGIGPCASPSQSTVKVTMTDVAANGGFTFSPAPIPCGTVTFILFNGGQSVHGLQLVDPNGTPVPVGPPVGSDQSATVTLTLSLDGQYEWRDSQNVLVSNFGYVYVGG